MPAEKLSWHFYLLSLPQRIVVISNAVRNLLPINNFETNFSSFFVEITIWIYPRVNTGFPTFDKRGL